MIIESGHYSLILALTCAFMGLFKTSRKHLFVISILLTLSFLSLIYSFITSDFSVALVAAHSHFLKPFLYKFTATWGNHEGSLLLWCLILSYSGLALKDKPFAQYTQNGLIFLFLAFLVFASNPFERLFPVPFNGQSLNPVLQDPALAIHPPLLYIGYIGTSILFSLSLSALHLNTSPVKWAENTLPWALWSWSFLTAGLVLGSYWAYYELGWGGWWFWDPVENAALMPWLLLTALIHALHTTKKTGHLFFATHALSITAFVLAVWGTFMVRSGLINSVHNFATDPGRGIILLSILSLISFYSYSIFLKRFMTDNVKTLLPMPLFSRETGMTCHVILITLCCLFVLIGTISPLFSDLFNIGLFNVPSDYYQTVFIPPALVLVFITGFSGFTKWQTNKITAIFSLLFEGSIFCGILIWLTSKFYSLSIFSGFIEFIALFSFYGAYRFWRERHKTLRTQITSWPQQWSLILKPIPMSLAHIGLSLAVLGMVGSTLLATEQRISLKVGETKHLNNGYHITLDAFEKDLIGYNYNSDYARLVISKNATAINTLHTEQRWYPIAEQKTYEIGLQNHAYLHDFYAVFEGNKMGYNDEWVFMIRYNPFIQFLWLGFAMMSLGGLIGFIRKLKK